MAAHQPCGGESPEVSEFIRQTLFSVLHIHSVIGSTKREGLESTKAPSSRTGASPNGARRLSRADVDERIAVAPPFGYPAPSRAQSDVLIRGYSRITRDPVTSQAKRNLLEAAYRVHGTDFLAVVAATFRTSGTALDLLLDVRCLEPRRQSGANGHAAATDQDFNRRNGATDVVGGHGRLASPIRANSQPGRAPLTGDCGCPMEQLLEGLIYCAGHRPHFDGRSDTRYDRNPSNPAAARFAESSLQPPQAAPREPSDLDLVADAYRIFKSDVTLRSRALIDHAVNV